MSIFREFTVYDSVCPPGVRLPAIDIDKRYYKELEVEDTISNLEFLRELCHQGAQRKGIYDKTNAEEYNARIEMELDVLRDLGFVDYILLNWDILNFCHVHNIPTGPGRGSAAGSLVLYLIDVTKVDPVEHELFFERFVSQSRARKIVKDGVTYLDGSLLADVDNDISYDRRAEVINYIEKKYPARTAKILTLNTLSGKLCIKECGKIVGAYSEQEVNAVSDLIPKRFGKVAPLLEAQLESDKFADWALSNTEVFRIAIRLEGLNKNTGVHPSGIAISYDKLEEICPVQLSNEGALVTGYDMNWVSELMVKFDILGLRTLTVIFDVCKQLGLDISAVDPSAPVIYKKLQHLLHPQGLFQIEAQTNFKVCKKIKPKNLDELSAVVALARPGALDFLDQYATYASTGDFQSQDPFFDDVLRQTGGIPLYQEQLMKMAVKVGFTLDEAEQLRRIVGKKKIEKMGKWKSKIKKKVREKGLAPEIGEVLWRVAEDSANYSFNKSHSLAYATLAAWTIYLKFSHPKEFFIALLRMTKYEPSPHEEINRICQELSHFNIKLLPPDLACSHMDFSIEGPNLRFGLNSIKGVSEKSLSALREFRNSDNPTKYDIFISAKQAGLNIGILSALIQAGSLAMYKTQRSRLVLEAQAFNLLTDREKRNFESLGEAYEWDILTSIHSAVEEGLMGDDGRPLMKPSRFNTFKKKYLLYKSIYDKNKKYEQFANWYFENQLLGYSPSVTLREVFSNTGQTLGNSVDFENLDRGSHGRFIGVIGEAFKGTSRNGNDYLKIILQDEVGEYAAMIMDRNTRSPSGGWRRLNTLTHHTEQGRALPAKGNIIIVYGSKGEDILFVDRFDIMDEKIYMKLSELSV